MTQEIYFAGGCFWGVEHLFKLIDGVTDTQTGYANGHTSSPTYEQVCTNSTGFAETVKVVYDPLKVGLDFLLGIYFMAIDPTSLNKQGEDTGTQYRTGIYYVDPQDRPVIDNQLEQVAERYFKPIVVEVEPLRNFFPAEDYHQDYLEKNPSGYCHLPLELFAMVRNLHPKP